MKNLIVIMILFMLMSCKSNTDKDESTLNKLEDNIELTQDSTETNKDTEKNSAIENSKTLEITDTNTAITSSSEGTYVNIDNVDAAAGCNTINLNFNTATPLCIDKDGIIISVSYSRSGNIVIITFNGVIENQKDDTIPFEDFDTNTTLAEITLKPNGFLKLDWKGFTINNDLATDYAILGKKNLEGTFKKKK